MPQNELNRLEAVNRFLQIKIDKHTEINEVSQLAAEICGVPQGLITLVNEDSEYVFMDDAFTFSSGRDASFCHYVLESETVMVVNDAQLDPRLKNYPAVTRNAGIRFYAGAPLTTHDGHRLGSLCVIDHKPGKLSIIQMEMLQSLAGQIIQLLEFESNLNMLKEQFLSAKKLEMKMRSFFESTTTSHLLLDKHFKVIAYNKAVEIFIKTAYGVDMYEGMDVTQFIDQAYMTDFLENCSKALSGETIRRERLLNFAGKLVWCMLSYDPARNSNGDIIGISYNSSDITDRVNQQQMSLDKQTRLDHIAYIQSHEFRRPVASMKGLIHLLELECDLQDCQPLQQISKAINDIDEKIAQVVNYTSSASLN